MKPRQGRNNLASGERHWSIGKIGTSPGGAAYSGGLHGLVQEHAPVANAILIQIASFRRLCRPSGASREPMCVSSGSRHWLKYAAAPRLDDLLSLGLRRAQVQA
jgi:hypothetical protein